MPQHIIIFYTNLPPLLFFKETYMFVANLPQTSKRNATNKYLCRKPTRMFATNDSLPLFTTSQQKYKILQKHLLNDLVLIWVQVNQQRHIYIQYTYIVGKYKIYLHELQKQAEQRAFRELFMPAQQRVQMNFIFNDNVRILCLSCNVKKVVKIVRFKQKGKKQASFLTFH